MQLNTWCNLNKYKNKLEKLTKQEQQEFLNTYLEKRYTGFKVTNAHIAGLATSKFYHLANVFFNVEHIGE